MTQATPIYSCLGWKPADDNQTVLVGFQSDQGHFSVAMDETASKETIFNLVHALGTFKKPKARSGERLVIDASWIDLGLSRDKKSAVLSLRFSNGGELAFRLPVSLVQRFLDSLDTLSDPDATRKPPSKTSH